MIKLNIVLTADFYSNIFQHKLFKNKAIVRKNRIAHWYNSSSSSNNDVIMFKRNESVWRDINIPDSCGFSSLDFCL